jgi:hypothetical protein
MAAEVRRFERFCSEERSFGVEVERVIQEIDELAQEGVEHAEAELEVCQTECGIMRDRMRKAREGEYPICYTSHQPLNLDIFRPRKRSFPQCLCSWYSTSSCSRRVSHGCEDCASWPKTFHIGVIVRL